MALTELSLKWCWKIFSLVHCLQAAEAVRQNLLNKESLVLHKGLEMWAMDSASLYSGESIITEDAMQDREKRQREREGERDRGRPEIQWKGRGVGSEQRNVADVLCCAAGLPLPCWVSEGMQGRLSSGMVEANHLFWGGLMDSSKNI